SLFMAGKEAGLSQSMVVKLAKLFEWDLDFTRDIHAGDRFRVVYESKYFQGKRERDGEIVAAEFVNQGRVLQVFRYTDPSGNSGYYDAKGQSIRKIFIRTPVDFTRITSLFTKHRKHPIFGFTRAHKGVDYAAPQGTPVRASGDGRVTYIGHKGDYGQFITIRHNDTYSTAYAHLSSFGRGLRVGSQVKQGEVIGRVGTTGASTGPHLHYEVRVHDEPVNPLSIQQIMANPVSPRFAEDFRQHSQRAVAMLHTESAPRVAALHSSNENDD
ncbi:peptidoglycan DD-metalloendopeptidase family protein, partial [Candidatus Magnetaquicoccus inordinatus]|uniref:peptidoglycan DD-metalloendopeptidase family protein n=1 Tax=Candidatus Magnetaquicoccus inordinatus TaxID=2496818 RepID=UPI00102BD586